MSEDTPITPVTSSVASVASVPNSIQTREDFVRAVQKWVAYDTELQALAKQSKLLRNERAQLQPSLTSYMEDNGLCQNTIKITGGTLKYNVETTRQGFTQRLLSDALTKFFENDHVKANACLQFIRDQRQEKRVSVLKRSYDVED